VRAGRQRRESSARKYPEQIWEADDFFLLV